MAEKAITKESVKKSQTNANSKKQSDLIEIEIVKDGNFYKKGQKDRVHPSLAEILKEKGLIK